MNDGSFNHDPHEPRLDDNDPVWHLLAESPRPEPDAWFAVRTLARCRYTELGAEMRGTSFMGIWRWVLGGGLGLSLAVFLLMTQIHSESVVPDKQKNVQEAFAIIASLNSTDDDSTTTSSWQDNSL